eukprot:762958-Hanusia_phi.AAC.12
MSDHQQESGADVQGRRHQARQYAGICRAVPRGQRQLRITCDYDKFGPCGLGSGLRAGWPSGPGRNSPGCPRQCRSPIGAWDATVPAGAGDSRTRAAPPGPTSVTQRSDAGVLQVFTVNFAGPYSEGPTTRVGEPARTDSAPLRQAGTLCHDAMKRQPGGPSLNFRTSEVLVPGLRTASRPACPSFLLLMRQQPDADGSKYFSPDFVEQRPRLQPILEANLLPTSDPEG